jgi:hypothetical protein
MPDKKYTMIESVGSSYQVIHSYVDIEKHHPTWKETPNRHYQNVDGKREEVAISPTNGEAMVSKDIIFKVYGVSGSSHVNVPSPFTGYAKLDERSGTVDVYDQPDGKGNLIGRVRHMDPILVKNNQHIEYGEPLGIQGGKNPSKPFGPHAHIDVSLSHLDEFKQFIKDVDAGVITTEKYPAKDISFNAVEPEINASSATKNIANSAGQLGLIENNNLQNPQPNRYPIADWSDRSQPIREYNQQDGTSKLYTFNSDGVPIREQQLDVNGVDINQKISQKEANK